MVASVTEGEDKPLKYPLMFRTCELVLVNKIDLLPHLDFDLDRFLHNLEKVQPRASSACCVSARTGEGVEEWREWLVRAAAPRRARRHDADRLASRRSRADRAPHCGPTRRSSTQEAERIARLCHRMAERFARGGRLIAVGQLSGGALGRAPRGGRVRAPGDRRQAGAARDRAAARAALSDQVG